MMYLYNNASESGKAMADALGLQRITHGPESRYRGHPDKTVINWGASELPTQVCRSRVINNENAVWLSVNKLRMLRHLSEYMSDALVEWTEDIGLARGWVRQGGHAVYCRTRLTGHDGEGLVRATTLDEIVEARLYTKEVRDIVAEYRVTVCNKEVVCLQRKVRAADHVGPVDPNIRTTAGGWGFIPAIYGPLNHNARSVALHAIMNLDLDFGGVDVVVNRDRDAYVLEVNTAPMLTPMCLDRLSYAIKRAYLDV